MQASQIVSLVVEVNLLICFGAYVSRALRLWLGATDPLCFLKLLRELLIQGCVHNGDVEASLIVEQHVHEVCAKRMHATIMVSCVMLWSAAACNLGLNPVWGESLKFKIIVYLNLVGMTLVAHGRYIRATNTRRWFSGLMCWWVCIVALCWNEPGHIRHSISQASFIPRVILALSCSDLRLLFFWNFICSGGTASLFRLHPTVANVGLELIFMMLIVGIGSFHLPILWRWQMKQLESEELKREQCAGKSLLHSLCDCVVELDENASIIGSATGLAAILLRGANRSLENEHFPLLIVSDADRELFDQEMEASAGHAKEGSIGIICVRMADALYNTLTMELLHVPFDSATGHLRRFVGIREVSSFDVEYSQNTRADKFSRNVPLQEIVTVVETQRPFSEDTMPRDAARIFPAKSCGTSQGRHRSSARACRKAGRLQLRERAEAGKRSRRSATGSVESDVVVVDNELAPEEADSTTTPCVRMHHAL
eukprot:TRINITY_DN35021_c0_g1_i1.p1 TRINITY_DN35021_c0_g1~~TRINITY_DN35021_c0_g1_i1.p1  ORF type:complete len:483 (+),score=63.98 TRINITY_DN35021_c0_g1_i1:95-1543(+)